MSRVAARAVYCTACGQPLTGLPPTKCVNCGAMQWNDARPCGCALVASDAQLLMVQRARDPWKGLWEVPGGFCEAAEHPAAAAVREVYEETGLEVKVTGFLGIWVDDYNEPGHVPKQTMNVYYHAVPIARTAVSPQLAEVSRVAFFRPDEIPHPLAFPGHASAAIRAWKRAAAAGMLQTPLFDLDAAEPR